MATVTTPSRKRKRVVLPIEVKLRILDRLDQGATGTTLAVEYNLGKSTISDNRRPSNS